MRTHQHQQVRSLSFPCARPAGADLLYNAHDYLAEVGQHAQVVANKAAAPEQSQDDSDSAQQGVVVQSCAGLVVGNGSREASRSRVALLA